MTTRGEVFVATGKVFGIDRDLLCKLCPLHVLVDDTGQIVGAGPTLQKVLGPTIVGQVLFDAFAIKRPRNLRDMADLARYMGQKLTLQADPTNSEGVMLRGMAVPLQAEGRTFWLIDLAFGANFAEVVAGHALTATDFKPNDASIDLLYTFETQRGLLKDSEDLARALRRAKAEAERMAMQDPLTGLANRRALNARLDQILAQPVSSRQCALLLVDLNEFKDINDNFGHEAGDRVLKHAAACLEAIAGPKDLAVRIGGDEFALIIDAGQCTATIDEIADNLASRIATPVKLDRIECAVGASIGILVFDPAHSESMNQLMKEADIALYEAKLSKRNTVLVTPELLSAHDHKRLLANDIERGLQADEFVPFFHPQMDANSGEVIGLEVLARWDHPVDGTFAPGYFLPAAHRSNQLITLDRQVRRKAMAQFASIAGAELRHASLSLNVTAANLRAAEFEVELEHELVQVGLSPDRIALELLETIFFEENDEAFLARCHGLRDAGFELAIDDFGTGHASISTLIDAPIHLLKVDRSFVSGIDQSPRLNQITGSIIRMAREINLAVLAEGVETEAELDGLMALGCHLFQGFHFAKPMRLADLQIWLADNHRPHKDWNRALTA